MSKKGIFVPKDFDEMKKINADRIAGINDDGEKHFRIWPTSACNARCYYCFEKGIKTTTMTMDVADKVVKHISEKLNNGDLLRIEWFGGEPLLNIPVIDYIYDKLKILCKQKNSKMRSTIITNGSLIDGNLAKKMKEDWGISLAQITLDGQGKAYDKIKNYYNPKAFNFKNTINSIKLIAKEGIHVGIRMNYDTQNYESLVDLINYLKVELKDYPTVSYYVYPVWSSTEEDVEDSFNSKTEADKNLLKLFDLLVKNKMSTPRKVARLNYKRSACQAWCKNSFTILPDGSISKCAETYNLTIGNVIDGITDEKAYKFWINHELDNKCKECTYLPLCQGGCKSSHFNRMPQCFAFKPIIKDIVKWFVDCMEREKSNK